MTLPMVQTTHDKCGKRNRAGGQCGRPAGWGTDHVGQGPCKLHGGANRVKHGRYSIIKRPRIAELIEQFATDANPLETLPEIQIVRALLVDGIERYDEITEATLAWHASYAQSMRPLHPRMVEALEVVLDELEALAGPFTQEGEEEQEDAVATAYGRARILLESLRTPPELKPRKVVDLTDLHTLAESVTRMVERVQKARSALHISRPDFFRIMGEMGRVVELSNGIESPEQRIDAIRDGWKAIRLA